MCHLPQPHSPAYPQAISGILGAGRLEGGTCSLLAIRRGSSACRYGNAYQYAVILYLRFSALRTDLSPRDETRTPNTLLPRVTSSVPKLFGRTVGNSGRSLEPSCEFVQLGSSWGQIGPASAYPSPTRTSGIYLSDLTDCPVTLDNMPKSLARNFDEHHGSIIGAWRIWLDMVRRL